MSSRILRNFYAEWDAELEAMESEPPPPPTHTEEEEEECREECPPHLQLKLKYEEQKLEAARRSIKELEEEVELGKQKCSEQEEQLQKVQRLLNGSEEELGKAWKEIERKGLELQSVKSATDQELRRVGLELQKMERKLKESEKQNEGLRLERKGFVSGMKGKVDRIKEMTGQNEEYWAKERKSVDELVESLFSKINTLDEANNELERMLKKETNKLVESNSKNEAFKAQVTLLETRAGDAQKQLLQMKKAGEEKDVKLCQMSEALNKLEKISKDKSDQISGLKKDFDRQTLDLELRLKEIGGLEKRLKTKNKLFERRGRALARLGKMFLDDSMTEDRSPSPVQPSTSGGSPQVFSTMVMEGDKAESPATKTPIREGVQDNTQNEESIESPPVENEVGGTPTPRDGLDSSGNYSLRKRGTHLRSRKLNDSILGDTDSDSQPQQAAVVRTSPSKAPTRSSPRKRPRRSSQRQRKMLKYGNSKTPLAKPNRPISSKIVVEMSAEVASPTASPQ